MAKVPVLKDDRSISREIRQNLSGRAGLSHWGYDSMGRILADTVTNEIALTNAEDRRAFEAIQLSSANGADLDAVGIEWCNLSRRPAARASATTNHRCMAFYTSSLSFGEINDGQSIVIPAGAFIGTTPDVMSGIGIIYAVDKETTLSADQNLAYVSISAVGLGEASNVGEGVLSYHNVAYVGSPAGKLKCANFYPILNGRDQETDSDYRFRIYSHIPAIVQNNLTNIQLAVLQSPGVKIIKTIPGYFGIGTVAVVCFGTDNETSRQLTESVQNNLNRYQSPGLMILAIPGVRVYFDLELRCLLTEALTATESQALERSIKRSIFSALKEREFSSAISLQKVANRVLRNHPEIAGLVDNKSSCPGFEAAYIRKQWSDKQPISERKKLVTNSVQLKEEEHVALGDITIIFDLEA